MGFPTHVPFTLPKSQTKEYRAYRAMIQRCTNPNGSAWRYYGGRGILVCDRWLDSFDAFLADVGPAPSGHMHIDRIDNDGNYEPGNVRWVTPTESARNRRMPHKKRPEDRTVMLGAGFPSWMADEIRSAAGEMGESVSSLLGRMVREQMGNPRDKREVQQALAVIRAELEG